MASVKLGIGQINKPTPLFYRRFLNVMLIAVLPGLATVLSGWGLPQVALNHALLIITFVGGILKLLGTFMGNGQIYADDPNKKA